MVRTWMHRGPLALFMIVAFLRPSAALSQSTPTPEEHFGFAMGTTGEMARWDGILEYFEVLAARSPRIRVDTLGPTTLGNPYVVIQMSSPTNLARVSDIHAASRRLASGRIPEAEARRIAADLPATVLINHNIHSTEVGSSQTSVELVHRLATSDDPEILEILDNVVTVLIPSANPDGQIMVTDWYYEIKDSDTPRARMPYLYHHYAGHDNNRDYFQGALVETRYWFDVMFRRSAAQIYLDQHQMGGNGPRIFVPPYPDPMNANIHPLLWQGTQFVGGGIVRDLQAAGKQGVISGAMYRIFGQEGALTQRYHNVIGLLTETASANLASPDTVTMDELERGGRRLGPDGYEFSMSMPDPWPGGVWTLGDIVDNQMIAALSVLRQAARDRQETVLGRWQMAAETIQGAEATGPYAIVIPATQHDPTTTRDLIRRLTDQNIEIHRATDAFEAYPTLLDTIVDVAGLRQPLGADTAEDEGDADDEVDPSDAEGEEPEEAGEETDEEEPEPVLRHFEAGSYIVYLAQQGRAAILDLLEPRFLPVRHEYPGGPFLRMYDAAAYTMAMQMGVETVRVEDPFQVATVPVTGDRENGGAAPARATEWYVLAPESNVSYRIANSLLGAGFTVRRAAAASEGMSRGAFLVPAAQPGVHEAMKELAAGIAVSVDPPDIPASTPMQRARIGLYQGWAASMDEGWTRLLFEEYGFDYESLSNDDVQSADVLSGFDVVVIPSEIPLDRLVDGAADSVAPAAYVGGIGEEGIENLKHFVEAGGTLVTLERGDEVVLEHFEVPIRNALEGVSSDEFFLPASVLNLELDSGHDLSTGSPRSVYAKWAGGRAYEPSAWGDASGSVKVVGQWAASADELLAAGQLVGAERIAGRGAILDVRYGEGSILMYGFRVQHRMQTHGTFKLFFNALYRSGRPASTDG